MQCNQHYQLVAKTIGWLSENQYIQPNLALLSAEIGISPHHLQRVFQQWAGVSPKQFLKSLTRKAAVDRLIEGSSVLNAALESGLSGPGRLHDLVVSTDALTPGEIRKHGAGVELHFGFGETPFGTALISWTGRGVSFLGFCEEMGEGNVLESLREQWENAQFVRDSVAAQRWLDRVFEGSRGQPIPLWLRGSPFQLKIWQALISIPEGRHATYGQLAAQIGHPGAARAAGSAIGANPVAWIIPCHRVICQMGELGGYRWGAITKSALIGYEAVSDSR